jgi:hypothetical protein
MTPSLSQTPPQVVHTGPSIQADTSAQAAVRRTNGAAGGPNTSVLRPEPGTLGQGKGSEPAAPDAPAPAAPAVAASPPVVEPESPVAALAPPPAPSLNAPTVPPSAAAGVADPPNAVAEPADVPSAPTPSSSSTVQLADWSVPLAVAGGLLAGVALALQMVRRQQHAIGPAHADGRALPHADAAPAAAYGPAAPHWDDRPRTHPGLSYSPGENPSLLTRSMRPATSPAVRPIRDAVGAAPNARLNGSPVPYLRPVKNPADYRPESAPDTAGQTRPGYSTNVAGLSWSEPSTDERADRALA